MQLKVNQIRFTLLAAVIIFGCTQIKEYKHPDVVFTLTEEQLPDYEKNIDHKGLITAIQDRSDESLRTGQYIYSRTCFNCHGDPLQQGSIPISFKFWEGKFKVGNDPYAIYQTLTKGYGSMPPQTLLKPSEKYDVINYIRDQFVVKQNKQEYFEMDSAYLSSLPTGTSKGPTPTEQKPWAEMDYGNFLINTYELVNANAKPRERSEGKAPLKDENLVDANFAYKGIAVRLDKGEGGIAAGNHWIIFDHDLMRVAGAWSGRGFIDWEGILFNGTHNISPRTVGELQFANPVVPGWANPATGSFADNRFMASDKRRFGPLARDWAHYKGLYQFEGKSIVSYTVGGTPILEMFGLEMAADSIPIFTRTLSINSSTVKRSMRVALVGTSVALVGSGATLKHVAGFIVLEIPKSKSLQLKLLISKAPQEELDQEAKNSSPAEPLEKYTKGGAALYPQPITTLIHQSKQEGPFQIDVLSPPFNSPWKNQLRLSGLDFLSDKNKMVVCSTDGDVWLVEGIDQASGKLTWTRIASGLFQPLGIKVVNEKLFVTCRDQLVKLIDLNGDGETDFYESFNSDHQVTNHFHEFAMGLQADAEGNFYYAKSARHARRALVPQHGTLLKVTKDGSSTEIIATGFRAANGVCINPDGSFIVTDQEGHWNPMNRINWVTKGKFYGNMFGYNPPADSSNTGMEQPVVWVERNMDQSPSELLWVESKNWGPWNGNLLDLSYGYGKILNVMQEKIGTQRQGGVFELPLPRFSTGVMRGRFNQTDGNLYACGLSAWGSTQAELGGLYRIRYQETNAVLPVGLNAKKKGMKITFSNPVDAISASQQKNYQVKTWDLKRSRKYGSEHYNTQTLNVDKVEVSADGKSVLILLPQIKPTWVMEITYEVKGTNGKSVKGVIQNTIHQLGE
jgi:glucose/arabinose dehydrogenase/cytochrome c5